MQKIARLQKRLLLNPGLSIALRLYWVWLVIMETKPKSSLKGRNKTVSWIYDHQIFSLTILWLILSCAVLIIPLPALNITYTTIFNQAPGNNATFNFDYNSALPSASIQTASIKNNRASVVLDPLNANSHSLIIDTHVNGLSLESFEVSITVPKNGINYQIFSLPGTSISTSSRNGSSSFSLSANQLSTIQMESREKSAIKPVLLFGLILIYLIAVIRVTTLKRLPKGYFAAFLFAVVCITVFLTNLWTTSTAPSHYRILAACLTLVLATALVINHMVGTRCGIKGRRAIILADYGGILAYVLLQARYFMQQLGGFPDEQAHLSYIAYMKLHGGWIPDFRSMRIYHDAKPGTLSLATNSTDQFNYLGHPPLYYKIMSLVGAMQVNGTDVSYHITRLRLISLGIGVLGLLTLFYIAYTRIRQIPLLQLLFALIIISPANMVYGISGISNDTLALLTVSIFILGIIRFNEERYTPLTYFLIAIGISASVLTKLTAGMIVVISSLFVIFYTLVIKRKFDVILRPACYLTLPIYLGPTAYFLQLARRFQTIQPSYQHFAFSEYVTSGMYVPINNRTTMAFSQYVQYFFVQFLNNWSSILGHVPVIRANTTPFTFDAIAVTLIFLSPLCLFVFKPSSDQRFLSMGYGAILLVVAYQFKVAATGFYTAGYGGSTQSRYYQCAIGIFALSIIWMLSRFLTIFPPQEEKISTTLIYRGRHISLEPLPQLSTLGTAVVTGLCLILLYDGFINTFLLSGR